MEITTRFNIGDKVASKNDVIRDVDNNLGIKEMEVYSILVTADGAVHYLTTDPKETYVEDWIFRMEDELMFSRDVEALRKLMTEAKSQF